MLLISMAVIFTNTIIKIKSRVVLAHLWCQGDCVLWGQLHHHHIIAWLPRSCIHGIKCTYVFKRLYHTPALNFKPHASIYVFDETTDSGCLDPTRGPWITWTVRSCLHITLSFYRGVSTGLQTIWPHFLCMFRNLVSYVMAILLYHMVTT